MTSSEYRPYLPRLTAANQGAELLSDLLRSLDPDVGTPQIRVLTELLCASPIYSDWNAELHPTASVLLPQATVVAMAVQSWSERAELAAEACNDPKALANYEAACRVINSAMKYLPGGSRGAK